MVKWAGRLKRHAMMYFASILLSKEERTYPCRFFEDGVCVCVVVPISMDGGGQRNAYE